MTTIEQASESIYDRVCERLCERRNGGTPNGHTRRAIIKTVTYYFADYDDMKAELEALRKELVELKGSVTTC